MPQMAPLTRLSMAAYRAKPNQMKRQNILYAELSRPILKNLGFSSFLKNLKS